MAQDQTKEILKVKSDYAFKLGYVQLSEFLVKNSLAHGMTMIMRDLYRNLYEWCLSSENKVRLYAFGLKSPKLLGKQCLATNKPPVKSPGT
ncbi:hypothetical protein LguiA_018281 [Lonicera macranthoides]